MAVARGDEGGWGGGNACEVDGGETGMGDCFFIKPLATDYECALNIGHGIDEGDCFGERWEDDNTRVGGFRNGARDNDI